jgi:hypothetical protein
MKKSRTKKCNWPYINDNSIIRQPCQEAGFSLAKMYFKVGTSMKRLARLLSLLSFSDGRAAQDLWSSPPMKKVDNFSVKLGPAQPQLPKRNARLRNKQ